MVRQSSNKKRGLRWWDVALIIVGVPTLVLLIWLWIRHRAEQQAAPSVRFEIEVSPRPRRVPKPAPDDLKRIEGIGPKTASALQAADITTYAQLAATDGEWLRAILKEAGVRANPTTWPEQAELAASGRWDALKALQAELKGGVRV
jgi:predicted flap endonuclease-1-like 5' DNA nuclease